MIIFLLTKWESQILLFGKIGFLVKEKLHIMTRAFYIADSDKFGKEKSEHFAFSDYKTFEMSTIHRGTKEIIYHWYPTLRMLAKSRDGQRRSGCSESQENKERYIASLDKIFVIGHSVTGISVPIHEESTYAASIIRVKTELDSLFMIGSNQISKLSLCDVAVLCDSKLTANRVKSFLEKEPSYK